MKFGFIKKLINFLFHKKEVLKRGPSYDLCLIDELPTIEEFIGSDPDFTGEMSTGEYISKMRE